MAKVLAYFLALLITVPVVMFAAYDLVVFQPQTPVIRRLLERAAPDERVPAPLIVNAARASVSQHLSGFASLWLMREVNALRPPDEELRGHLHGVLWWALVALHLSEQEQATLFLSLADMGSDTRGFSAASQAMFGVPLTALSIEQAATLAAVSKSPKHYLENPGRLERARAAILKRMPSEAVLP